MKKSASFSVPSGICFRKIGSRLNAALPPCQTRVFENLGVRGEKRFVGGATSVNKSARPFKNNVCLLQKQ